MIKVTNHGVLLQPTTLEFESQAVLNPGCVLVDGILHMAYRAVAPGNYSSIGYAQFKDNQLIYRATEPILKSDRATEQHGIEDPRLVFYDGTYYLFYVAYDGTDAQVAYATATELPHFTKQGIISSRLSYKELQAECENQKPETSYGYFCTHYFKTSSPWRDSLIWEKDSFMFPRKINGQFALIYRFSPEIQVIFFDKFSDLTTDYWLKNFRDIRKDTVLVPEFPFEELFIGGGCPPIETEAGWLLIYHAVGQEDGKRIYRAGAALLDLHDPTRVIGRLPYPLFSPDHEWEKQGDVPNVVFPSGAVVEDGVLSIYYGAADSSIGYCTVNLADLVQELLFTEKV